MSGRRPGDFSSAVKTKAKERVAGLCSNPDCRASTEAGVVDSDGSFRVADCAHICSAAKKKGPRHREMLPQSYTSFKNALWLCGVCHRKVDLNYSQYPTKLLRRWKDMAEEYARRIQGIPKSQAEEAARPSVSINVGTNLGHISGGDMHITYHEKPRRVLRSQRVPEDTLARLVKLASPIMVQVSSETDEEAVALSDAIRGVLAVSGAPVDPMPGVAYGSGLTGTLAVATIRQSVEQEDPMLALAQWLAAEGLHVTFVKGYDRNVIQVAPR